MVRRTVLLAGVMLMLAVPAHAGKVTVDYDQNYSKTVKTFQWEDSDKAPKDSLVYQRVMNAIKHELTDRGLVEVKSGGDIFVTAHGSTKEQTNYNTTTMGYGFPGGWYGYGGVYGGMGMSSSYTTTSTWEIGTLVIDAVDADTKKLIWRGTAQQTLASNPQKNEKKINLAIDKMFIEWDNIKKKIEKQKAKEARKKAKEEAKAKKK